MEREEPPQENWLQLFKLEEMTDSEGNILTTRAPGGEFFRTLPVSSDLGLISLYAEHGIWEYEDHEGWRVTEKNLEWGDAHFLNESGNFSLSVEISGVHDRYPMYARLKLPNNEILVSKMKFNEDEMQRDPNKRITAASWEWEKAEGSEKRMLFIEPNSQTMAHLLFSFHLKR